MSSNLKLLFLTLGISPKFGGPYKSVNLFKKALGGQILALSLSEKSGSILRKEARYRINTCL
ncbi:MAG: hypothetical protein CBB97_19570 [Candidatus Endolissoclinum sp. TMED37]|nr:MAG: hypothetical protein CBB97_19570 [Candidatus Endolissoclinum sp. TMED37]